MSLRVWLPLTKDLRNQGLDDIEITNNGATFNSAGKLGGCHSFSGSSQKIVNTLPSAVISSIGSLSCWVKMNSLPSSSGFYNLMQIGNLGGYATCRLGLYMEYTNKINISIDGSSTGANVYTHSLVANQWYHICATYNGTIVKLYIDGNEVLSKTASRGSYTTAASYLYVGGTSSYYLNGYMNDARYYDHALSPMEVKELSKGLVLHYRLSGVGGENLVLNSSSFLSGTGGTGITSSTTADGLHQVIASSGNNNWHTSWASSTATSLLENTFTEGDPFTISFTIKSENANKTNPPTIYVKSGMGYYSLKGTVGPNWSVVYYSGTWKDDNPISFHLGFSGLVGTYLFKNWKLEKGSRPTPWCPNPADPEYSLMGFDDPVEWDCSGFGNNGIKVGEFKWESNTARYTGCYRFNGTNNAIQTPDLTSMISDKNYTISCWVYKSVIGTKNYQTIYGGPTGFELEARNSNSTDPAFRIHNWGAGTTPYEFNKWYHFCFVQTSDDSKLYINGELKITGTSATIPSGNYFIGSWRDSNSQNFEGLMSDFRIFATPLSSQEILSLYNLGGSLDSSGTFHTYEYVEA